MARNLESRIHVAAELVTETPLHVGGFGETIETDLPLARNGGGEFYVPGTSLTGVLREWCERAFPRGEEKVDQWIVEHLWGAKLDERGEGDDRREHASFVIVKDATLRDAGGAFAEVRDGVGINRFTGTASDRFKFDRMVLPRGTRVNLEMIIELMADEERNGGQRQSVSPSHRRDDARALVAHLLDALRRRQMTIGAARTRGLGRVRSENLFVREEKLNARAEMLSALKLRAQDSSGRAQDATKEGDGNESRRFDEVEKLLADWKSRSLVKPRVPPRLEVAIKWKPRQPLMVKAGYDGVGVDMLPLVSGTGDNMVAMVLPGSSIKGALRAHAERIIRTLRGEGVDCDTDDSQAFLRQLDVPLVRDLFGIHSTSPRTMGEEKTAGKNGGAPQAGRGVLAIADCYAAQGIDAAAWQKIEIADLPDEQSHGETELWRALREANLQDSLEPETHVAIDRWTGGAADSMLYNLLAPVNVAWEDFSFGIDFSRLSNDLHLPATALLLLLLRDLACERIPLGFATTRGMGEIEVEKISLTTNDYEPSSSPLTEILPPNINLALNGNAKSKLLATMEKLDVLQTSWQSWIDDSMTANGDDAAVTPGNDENTDH